jgi:nicotinate-nucleotide pyrophosphorylase (carboxylating)
MTDEPPASAAPPPPGGRGPAAARPSPGRRRLDPALVDRVLRAALAEDEGSGDLTSRSAVPADARARGLLTAKSEGVLAGALVFARAFELCDPGARVERLLADGARLEPGALVATVEGSARALLLAERTALNFVQRMSGTATLTARFVQCAAGRARILDTRKTTPGLRAFEKYAVLCGGGENHRFGLFDEVMIKDNHVELAGRPLEQVVREVRAGVGPDVRMTVEARDRDEALAAVRGGADVVLLDNMTPARMSALAPELRALAGGRRVELEASGGITLDNLAEVAACGVDRISIGALTHSAPALDLSLSLEPAS